MIYNSTKSITCALSLSASSIICKNSEYLRKSEKKSIRSLYQHLKKLKCICSFADLSSAAADILKIKQLLLMDILFCPVIQYTKPQAYLLWGYEELFQDIYCFLE
jgi:hypothetical protein